MRMGFGLGIGRSRRAAGGGGGVDAPVAAGGIPDQEWTVDEAITPLDVSTDFTGSDITYSLISGTLPTGLSLSSGGVITGTPTVEATGTLVIRGTNGGGSDDTAFGFTVSAAVVPPEILSANLAGDVVSVTTDRICDLYYWPTQNATEDPADVIANGDFVTLTDTDQDITDIDAGLTPDGTWYLHLVAEDGEAFSATTSVEFEVANLPSAFTLVRVDGDKLSRTNAAIFTGGAKTLVLFAVNLVRDAASATVPTVFLYDAARDFSISHTSTGSGEVRVTLGSTSFRIPAGLPTSGSPETLLLSIDTSQATIGAGVKAYRNGADIDPSTFNTVTWTVGTDLPAASTTEDTYLFNNAGSTAAFVGTVGFVYFDVPASLPDLDDSAVRAKFEPGPLISTDGAEPTGAAPAVFFHGDEAYWDSGVNLGSGGNFVLTGDFTTP